jgi:hypothetical protein
MRRRSRPRAEDPAELRAAMPRWARRRRRNESQRFLENDSLSRANIGGCIPSVRVALTPFPLHSRLHHNRWASAPRPAAKASLRGSILSEAARIRRSAYNPRSDNGVLQTPARAASTVAATCSPLSVRRQTTRKTRTVAGRSILGSDIHDGVAHQRERDPRGSVTELGRTASQPISVFPPSAACSAAGLTLPRPSLFCSTQCTGENIFGKTWKFHVEFYALPRKSQDDLGA